MTISVAELLERAVARTPLQQVSGPGYTGATLEALTLGDGSRLVVKRISPRWDLGMRVTRDRGRAATLWATGALDRLPPGIDHAIIAAERDGDGWVIVMRDVSDALLPPERMVTRAEFRRIFTAARDMHRAYRATPSPDVCSLTTRLGVFTPATMAPLIDSGAWLPAHVCRGWELFDAIAPREIADAIRSIHAYPHLLASEMERSWTTMIHGDLWIANIGLAPDCVVFLDWGIATLAPPAFEFTMFLTGCWSRVEATREEMIDDIRALYGEDHDERALQLSCIATFSEFGWNKALDSAENPDPTVRGRETDELRWWLTTVARALETTWSPR